MGLCLGLVLPTRRVAGRGGGGASSLSIGQVSKSHQSWECNHSVKCLLRVCFFLFQFHFYLVKFITALIFEHLGDFVNIFLTLKHCILETMF